MKKITFSSIFLALYLPVQRLPLKFHYFWGRAFTFLTRSILHYRRDVVMTNLARSFPEKKYGELREIAKEYYNHIGEIFAEAMWFGGCRGKVERLVESGLCTIPDPEPFFQSYRERPSVMVLSSHFGNWELLGGFFQYFGRRMDQIPFTEKEVCVVYKKVRSGFWNDFCKVNRCAAETDHFGGYTESHNVIRYAIEHKNEHVVYVFPTDQFPYKGAARHEVPSFMNQKTYVMAGGANLAHKFGMAVYYFGCTRLEKGKYETPLIKICDDASQMSPEEIMIKYYSILEKDIRNCPANYLWSHKRWK